jgi:hypothetical protein
LENKKAIKSENRKQRKNKIRIAENKKSVEKEIQRNKNKEYNNLTTSQKQKFAKKEIG